MISCPLDYMPSYKSASEFRMDPLLLPEGGIILCFVHEVISFERKFFCSIFYAPQYGVFRCFYRIFIMWAFVVVSNDVKTILLI